MPAIKSLIDKGAICIEESLKEKVKPKIEKFVKLTDSMYDEKNLHESFNFLAKAPVQLKLLIKFHSLK